MEGSVCEQATAVRADDELLFCGSENAPSVFLKPYALKLFFAVWALWDDIFRGFLNGDLVAHLTFPSVIHFYSCCLT